MSSQTITAGEAPAPTADTADSYLIHIDPRELLAHPGNLRRDLGDLTALRDTIASDGLLQAPTAVQDADGYRLVAGHRRAAAAAAGLDAGLWPEGRPATIPVLVRPDLEGRTIQQVLAMLNENDADQRRSLTTSERAGGYAQLAAFDVSAAEMARRTGKKTTQVKAALKLHGMSEPVRQHADAGTLTLDDIAALEEFEDDPKVVTRILKDAGTPWGIRHRISDERRKRADKARTEELRAELTEAGVAIISYPKRWPYECKAAELRTLIDAEGNTPDPQQVKTQPGYAAIIDLHRPDGVVYVCLDPEGMGYQRTGHSYYKSDAQRAAEAAAEQARRERAAALADARPIREQFIIETYGGAKAAKAFLVDALHTAVTRCRELARGDADLVGTLVGGDLADLDHAKTDRLNRVLAAQYIAAQEANLDDCGKRPQVWGNSPAAAVAWLDRLTADGYTLATAEAELRQELAEIAQQADNDQDDDE